MGVIDELALSGVDRVERSLGKRAALRALVPLLDTMPASAGRARGLLRAIEYAADLDEDAPLAALCEHHRTEPHVVASEARALIGRLLSSGRTKFATELAEAEVERARGGKEELAARYALGRALEVSDTRRALACFEEVSRRANEQPRLAQAALVREVRALAKLGGPEHRDEAALRAARLLPLERAEPEDRLTIAAIALDANGRYKRAAALDVLEAIVRERARSSDAKDRALARTAVRWAAWHAERSGAALTEIEADRIEAVLRHWPDAVASKIAIERLRALASGEVVRAAHTDPEAEALLPRGRAVLELNPPGPRADRGRALIGWLGLAAAHAARAGHTREANEALGELCDRIANGARPEASSWTAALLALRDERARSAGLALARALLSREAEPPPRGFASIAAPLDAAGAHELATSAWQRAAGRREEGAREQLASILCHRGWQAAERGKRDEAIALLREARRLAR